MSGDPENSYFSDGIAEEILNLLARIPELRVASRTSSFVFRDSKMPLGEIADALNAEIILEGSVRRSGNRVRITMQLIRAADDSHLWSEIYDRELTDIFAVQAEIAGQVVGALSRGEAGDIPIYKATDSARAYEFYLRGRQFYHEWDRGRLVQARKMFEKAIDLDANYAKSLGRPGRLRIHGVHVVGSERQIADHGRHRQSTRTADRPLSRRITHRARLCADAAKEFRCSDGRIRTRD